MSVSPEQLLLESNLVKFIDSIPKTSKVVCLRELYMLIPWARSLCKPDDTNDARFQGYPAKCAGWVEYGKSIQNMRRETSTSAFKKHVLVQDMNLQVFRRKVLEHCLTYKLTMTDQLTRFLAAEGGKSASTRTLQQIPRCDRERMCALWLTVFLVDVRPQRGCNLSSLRLSDVEKMLDADDTSLVSPQRQIKPSVRTNIDCFFMRPHTTDVGKFHRDFVRPTLVLHGPCEKSGKRVPVVTLLSLKRITVLVETLKLNRVEWCLLKSRLYGSSASPLPDVSRGPNKRGPNKWTVIYDNLDPEKQDNDGAWPWGLTSPAALQATYQQQIAAEKEPESPWLVGPCGEGTQVRSLAKGFVALVLAATGIKLGGFTDYRLIVSSFMRRDGSSSHKLASSVMCGHTENTAQSHYQAQYSTLFYSTLLYSTLLYSTLLYSTLLLLLLLLLYSTLKSTLIYSTLL
jgi:hypothetical protein